MGAPDSGMQAAEQPTAETLLTAFRTIGTADRLKHENMLDYWLSIRGDKEFPPLHDLDPLEITDAGPCSILLELIGGGQDAEIRHLGDALREHVTVDRIIDAPNPSLLSCIARKLPIVAISRDFLAFEDSFSSSAGTTRCWVTLLPLSSCGSWVDYVYAFVSVEAIDGEDIEPVEVADAEEASPVDEPAPELMSEETEVAADATGEDPEADATVEEPEAAEGVIPFAIEEAVDPPEETAAPVEAVDAGDKSEAEEFVEPPEAKTKPGFAKLLDDFGNLTGFYGQGVKIDPVVEVDLPPSEPSAVEQPFDEPEEAAPAVAEEPAQAHEPAPTGEGQLQGKLSEVRAMADEARMARLRAIAALHEGLSAAYDFAIDAESSPEEYLRLVEAQGLKIQLRAPMAPVVKLAFGDSYDADTTADLEAVLAWALKEELPRGSLAAQIEQAGGISELLEQVSRPS